MTSFHSTSKTEIWTLERDTDDDLDLDKIIYIYQLYDDYRIRKKAKLRNLPNKNT